MRAHIERLVSITWLLSFILLRCGEETLDVAITDPVDGSLVAGIVRIEAEASDNARCVFFYMDDVCIDTCGIEPYMCCWNTFVHDDSSSHYLYAIARDIMGNEACSDSVVAVVYNGDMIFADDYEPYPAHTYPDAAWYEIWMGAGSMYTYVDTGIASSGRQSFRLRGLASWVRTDGVELNLADIESLTYELSVMIPSSDSTGALFGFFYLLNPQLGTICNGIWLRSEDNCVYARGIVEDSTGFQWRYDTWHRVKVTLDYVQLRMNAWFDDEQIVIDLPSAPREWTDTFALATEYGSAGTVYFDDLRIFDCR